MRGPLVAAADWLISRRAKTRFLVGLGSGTFVAPGLDAAARLVEATERAVSAEQLARRELAKALRDVADLRAARDAAVREHLTADRHEQQARRERDEARDRAGDLLSRLHAIADALDAAGCPVPDGAREDVAEDRVRALLADRDTTRQQVRALLAAQPEPSTVPAIGLHCPRCGATNSADWVGPLGSPQIWCVMCGDEDERGPDIVDGCGPSCEHEPADTAGLLALPDPGTRVEIRLRGAEDPDAWHAGTVTHAQTVTLETCIQRPDRLITAVVERREIAGVRLADTAGAGS